MERTVKIMNSFLKHHYLPHLGLNLLFILAAGTIVSFRNLDGTGAAKVMEMYACISGILLLPPLFMAEADTEIWMLEKSKVTPMWKLYLGRVVAAVLVLAVTISIFVFRLSLGESVFEVNKLWSVSFSEALFLGGIGFFASAVTNQAVIGYMLSFLYYVGNIGAAKYFGKLGLFPMTRGKDAHWGWFFLAGAVLLTGGILIRERK